jgi:hypothetical protein
MFLPPEGQRVQGELAALGGPDPLAAGCLSIGAGRMATPSYFVEGFGSAGGCASLLRRTP